VDSKTLARSGASVFVAVAITATAIEMSRKEEAPGEPVLGEPIPASADPLRAALRRCSAMGEAGGSDDACLRAWAENRRRFLGDGARPADPPPLSPLPGSLGDAPANAPASRFVPHGSPLEPQPGPQLGPALPEGR
jgi:conjugative transfer region protein TrbK